MVRILSLMIFSAVISTTAVAGLDLRGLKLERLCGEVKRSVYDVDARSADIFCNVSVPAGLLNQKSKRQTKVWDVEKFETEKGMAFRTLYYNAQIIQEATLSEPEYKEFFENGKLIGYRGTVTITDTFSRDVRTILGAYYTADATGKIKDLAKIFVLDRSKLLTKKIPSDFVTPLAEFDSRVLPAERQGLWALTAEVVRIVGKDLTYGSSDILMKLAENLGGTSIYRLNFSPLKSITNPAAFFRANPGKGSHGAYCENLLSNGKPLEAEALGGDERYASECHRLTNELVAAMVGSQTNRFDALYAELDEEERGYLLLSSKEKGANDMFLKVFFDISHND